MSRPSHHERFARAGKVRRLLAALDQLDQLPCADDVAAWPAATWARLTSVANALHPDEPPSREPSAETIALVVAKLRDREESAPTSETRRAS